MSLAPGPGIAVPVDRAGRYGPAARADVAAVLDGAGGETVHSRRLRPGDPHLFHGRCSPHRGRDGVGRSDTLLD